MHPPVSVIVGLITFIVMLGERTHAADNDAPLRIMPLGESITAGYTDNPKWQHPFQFGYRSRLHTLLTEAGHSFEFVGRSPEPWDGKWKVPTNSPSPDLRSLNQDKHRGYGAWDIAGIQQNIRDWIKEDRPDIILLLVGINGINKESPQKLEKLIETIYFAKQDITLIVAQITPLSTYNQHLVDFNRHIRQFLVPTFSKKGYAISTVDLYQHFLTDPHDLESIDVKRLSNRVNHPTNELYGKMAESWFSAIESLVAKNKTRGNQR